jgi:hypothetical protein
MYSQVCVKVVNKSNFPFKLRLQSHSNMWQQVESSMMTEEVTLVTIIRDSDR